MASAGAIGDFQNESRGAQDEAGKKRRNGARSVHAGPQNSQDKTSGDRRTDIGLHALQIDVELTADVMDKRDPQQAQHHHHSRGHPAKIYELLLGSLRPELLVKIEGDERGSRIENGTHRTHDRRQQCCHHQADKPDWQEIEDESGISEIGLLHLLRKQRKSNDAWQYQHEDRQDL